MDMIKDQFNVLRSALDWDVKSRSGIDTSMLDIHHGLSELDNEIMRLGDFIRASKDAYENAEKKIDAELAKLNDFFNESTGSTYGACNYPINDNTHNPLETSLEHIGDLFRRIGQAIANMFMPSTDPKELLDLANDFIYRDPYTKLIYSTGLPMDKDIQEINGDFGQAGIQPLIGKYQEDSIIDMAGTEETSIFNTDIWTDVALQFKNIGDFLNSKFQDFKELAVKHQEIMTVIPSEIDALNYTSWISTMKRLPSAEEQYQYAISQIPNDKEAAHAMLLGWMATDPSSRGIDAKYYPQLLATLMTYKDKGSLTLQQLDAKYLEIYNRNEAAIRRAEEKAKSEESSFLDTAIEWTHTALDIIGWVPMCGDVCDLVNAGLYLLQNDFLNAALSCIAFIPAVGQGIKGILKKLFNAGDDAKAIAKILAKIDNPKAFIEKIKGACTKMLTWIKDLPKVISEMLDNPFIKKMLGGAKKGIDTIVDGISSMVKNATEWVQKKIDDVVGNVNKNIIEKVSNLTTDKIDNYLAKATNNFFK